MNNNFKRFLASLASVAIGLSGGVLLGNAPAMALTITKFKALSGALGTDATRSVAARAVTLIGVAGQTNGNTPVAYFSCWTTANPTAGTTAPAIEVMFTNAASGSNNAYFFPVPLPLGGTALTCGSYTLSQGTATASTNVQIFWQ